MKIQYKNLSPKEIHLDDETIYFNMGKILKKSAKEMPVKTKHIKRYSASFIIQRYAGPINNETLLYTSYNVCNKRQTITSVDPGVGRIIHMCVGRNIKRLGFSCKAKH